MGINKKDNNTSTKIDKGFVLLWSRLSHRRKFIRTLWLIAFTPILIFFATDFVKDYSELPFRFATTVLIWSLVFMGLGAIQAIYNYKKWQDTKKSGRD